MTNKYVADNWKITLQHRNGDTVLAEEEIDTFMLIARRDNNDIACLWNFDAEESESTALELVDRCRDMADLATQKLLGSLYRKN